MLDQPVPNPLAKNPNVYTHKVFAAIGLVLIGTIIAVAGIWYYVEGRSGIGTTDIVVDETTTTKVSTSSANSSDLVTYTNTKYSYSIKYSEDVEFGGKPSTTADKIQLTNGENDSYKFPEDKFIGIRIWVITTDKSLEDYLKETYPENQYGVPAFESGLTNGDISKITIDSVSGYKSSEGMKFESKEKIVWLKKSNYVYQITAFGNGETGTSYSEKAGIVFDQILSTFKFL